MAIALLAVGGIASLIGGIWLLVVAFKDSVLWGLLCLLVPGAALVFSIMKWQVAKTAFLIALAGGILSGVGASMYMASAAKDAQAAFAEIQAQAKVQSDAAKAAANK